MFYPSLEEVKKLSKQYSVIPICMELYADIETPISLFKRLLEDNCFLLESVEGGEKWARYSFLGKKPYITLINQNGITNIIEKGKTTTL